MINKTTPPYCITWNYLLDAYRHWRYVRAMLKAIDKARRNIWNEGSPASRASGLRVIRRFEGINGIRFDPFNSLHIETVMGHGDDESFFRAMRLLRSRT